MNATIRRLVYDKYGGRCAYCGKCHHYGDNDELILGDGTVITVDEEDWQ